MVAFKSFSATEWSFPSLDPIFMLFFGKFGPPLRTIEALVLGQFFHKICSTCMHCSMMHTACFSDRVGGVFLPKVDVYLEWGVCLGVSAQGGIWPAGGVCPGGVCLE